jgi:uracil-DNA glycosylase
MSCRSCGLWEHATQTVFGDGNADVEVILVGEQPGDKEDLAGHPFVGPAGKVLDQALVSAGINREKVYVTNIVKHFKSAQRGKWRIHKKPNAEEIAACRPWLDAEISLIQPRVVVCLGATAAKVLIGRVIESRSNAEKCCDRRWRSLLPLPCIHPPSCALRTRIRAAWRCRSLSRI